MIYTQSLIPLMNAMDRDEISQGVRYYLPRDDDQVGSDQTDSGSYLMALYGL